MFNCASLDFLSKVSFPVDKIAPGVEKSAVANFVNGDARLQATHLLLPRLLPWIMNKEIYNFDVLHFTRK